MSKLTSVVIASAVIGYVVISIAVFGVWHLVILFKHNKYGTDYTFDHLRARMTVTDFIDELETSPYKLIAEPNGKKGYDCVLKMKGD